MLLPSIGQHINVLSYVNIVGNPINSEGVKQILFYDSCYDL